MVLQGFNVFGAIIFVKQEMVITGTAILKDNKQISRTRKFPVTFPRNNADEVATFSASIEKSQASYCVSYRSFVISELETQESIADNKYIDSSMKTFLSAISNAVFLSEDNEDYIDKAMELEDLGMSEDEIVKALEKKTPVSTSVKSSEISFRQPSNKAEVRNIGGDIIIYTPEGYAFVDLNTAEEVAELLPIYLKKAKKGITDKDTNAWLMKTFSKKH